MSYKPGELLQIVSSGKTGYWLGLWKRMWKSGLTVWPCCWSWTMHASLH